MSKLTAKQICTCTGSCRGPDGLGEGWVCALSSRDKSGLFDGRIYSHPTHRAIYDLMQELEKLPASEQQTKCVTLAGYLQTHVAAMRARAEKLAKCLRDNAADCFPEEGGKKHYARLIMEGVADELDIGFNPASEKCEGCGNYYTGKTTYTKDDVALCHECAASLNTLQPL